MEINWTTVVIVVVVEQQSHTHVRIYTLKGVKCVMTTLNGANIHPRGSPWVHLLCTQQNFILGVAMFDHLMFVLFNFPLMESVMNI